MKRALFLLVLLPLSAEPWGWDNQTSPPVTPVTVYKKKKGPADVALDFYQKNISPVQGERCPMIPSCSEYTRMAIATYGMLQGVVMGVERLYLRENQGLFLKDRCFYEKVTIHGKRKYYDIPQANNIFQKKNWHYYHPFFYSTLFSEG